jgi:hypothetical protein
MNGLDFRQNRPPVNVKPCAMCGHPKRRHARRRDSAGGWEFRQCEDTRCTAGCQRFVAAT